MCEGIGLIMVEALFENETRRQCGMAFFRVCHVLILELFI